MVDESKIIFENRTKARWGKREHGTKKLTSRTSRYFSLPQNDSVKSFDVGKRYRVGRGEKKRGLAPGGPVK